MATGHVNGQWQIFTTTKSTSLNQSPKICNTQICQRNKPCAKFGTNQPQGLLPKWVKYNKNFLFIHLLETHSSQPCRWTFASDGSNVLFGSRWYQFPFRRSNPTKPPFWGAWIGIFKAKWRKMKIVYNFELADWISMKFGELIWVIDKSLQVIKNFCIYAATGRKCRYHKYQYISGMDGYTD